MERMIPLEQLAEKRLKIMVDAFIHYSNNLLEAGVDPDTVINANEKTWAGIGHSMAAALKPMFADKPKLFVTDQLGAMAKELYGMAVQVESVPEGRRFRITVCPWREQVQRLAIENPHRFCRSAHRGFLNALAETLAPELSVEMNNGPPGKEGECCVTVHLFPETTVGKQKGA
jgi:hypothetical protein